MGFKWGRSPIRRDRSLEEDLLKVSSDKMSRVPTKRDMSAGKQRGGPRIFLLLVTIVLVSLPCYLAGYWVGHRTTTNRSTSIDESLHAPIAAAVPTPKSDVGIVDIISGWKKLKTVAASASIPNPHPPHHHPPPTSTHHRGWRVEVNGGVHAGYWDDGYNEHGNCSRAYRPVAAPKAPPSFPRGSIRRNDVRILGMGFGTTSTRSVFSIMCSARIASLHYNEACDKRNDFERFHNTPKVRSSFSIRGRFGLTTLVSPGSMPLQS